MVRFKNRWFLVEFLSCLPNDTMASDAAPNRARELSSKLVWLALKQSMVTNFGDIGWGAVSTSLNIKYFSPTTNLCIIRVARDHHKTAWGAITLITNIDGKPYVPHVVHLAGTIKHVQLAAIKHDRDVIARLRARVASEGRAPRTDSYDSYLLHSEKEIDAIQD